LNVILTSVGFFLCFTVGISFSYVLGQSNTTVQYAPVVQSSDALIAAIASIVIAISSLIGIFVKAGFIDKRVGTVAVMAADSAWAVKDNRQSIKDVAQNSYDVAKLASPEAAAFADQKIAPVLDQATIRVNEYTPKVDKFAAIAKKLSEGKQADSIKEMKDDIPDKIVSS
jgi:hypothetical protein